MNKTIKYSFFSAILTIALMSFGVGIHAQTTGQPKTKAQVEAVLTNFDISMVLDAEGQEKYTFRQASSDKGSYFEMGSSVYYCDFTRKMGYDLDTDEKSGEIFPLEHPEMYKGFHYIVASHFFRHLDNKELQKKIGNEKIIGRPTTVYMVDLREHNAGYTKVWVDDQYGFTLQYEQFEFSPMKFYVTKFTVGGVKVEGLVKLDEYELKEHSEPEEIEPVIIEGVLSIAAMKKAASDAGFTVWGGWSTVSNWTTNSKSKAEPKDGLQISVRREGSNFMGVAIIEFETEEIAKEYVAFGASPDAYFGGSLHRSGVFALAIDRSLVEELEAKLLEALKKAGWK